MKKTLFSVTGAGLLIGGYALLGSYAIFGIAWMGAGAAFLAAVIHSIWRP